MTDPDNILHFTPVPLLRHRARGWTPNAQHAFIAALANSGVVAHAARSVGVTPRSACQLRARPGAESFAAAWDWTLEMALDAARGRAMTASLSPCLPLLWSARSIPLSKTMKRMAGILNIRASRIWMMLEKLSRQSLRKPGISAVFDAPECEDKALPKNGVNFAQERYELRTDPSLFRGPKSPQNYPTNARSIT